jgi:methionyl-tRNA formyltransferase
MRMVPALDAGPMLHVLRTPMHPDLTYGDLHDQLSELGAVAIVQALALLSVDAAREVAQDDTQATYAAKIHRESARLDFSQPALQVSRVIRAFDPRPGAHTTLNGAPVKCFGVRVRGTTDAELTDDALRASRAGTVRAIDAGGMVVRCGDGAVRIAAVQPAGKGRMTPLDWERGRGVRVGDRFDDTDTIG